VLSPGRRYLLIPEDRHIRILESSTGELAATLPATQGSSAVAVSDDGRRAAVLDRSALWVWDLTDPGAKPQHYQAETIGTPFTATLNWVGTERLMVGTLQSGLVLFSLPHKLAIWNYQFDADAEWESEGHRVREVAVDHLVYAALVSRDGRSALAVGAARLSGPSVDAAVASLDRESPLIIKPGTAVRLDVRAGANAERVQAALERKIKANRWKLDPAASTVVIAEMTRGQTQQVTYRSMGFGPSRGGEQTVTVTPEISTVRIEVGGKVAWSACTGTGAPSVLMLPKGQTAQSEIDRWQKPNVEFFEGLDIPDSILDPARRTGLGTTRVTTRGLISSRTVRLRPIDDPSARRRRDACLLPR
jgi:hypothetical protein